MDLPAEPGSELKLPELPAAFRSIGPSEVVAAFLNRHNENTRKGYARDLAVFTEFLEADSPAEALAMLVKAGHGSANAVALAYQRSLSGQYAAATVNRRLAAVRSLVSLAKTLGLIPWDLSVTNVTATPYKDTSGPGTDGFLKLIQVAERARDPMKQRRDVAILHLLFGMALRRAEVVALDCSDVDWDKRKISVKGKGRGGESDAYTMPPTVEEALLRWIRLRGIDPGPLFISLDPAGKGDGRLTPSGLWRMVRTMGEKVGIQVWPHALRHAGVTAALDATKDIRAVKRFSRHARLDTLLIYDDNRQDLGGQVAAKVAEKVAEKLAEAAGGHEDQSQDQQGAREGLQADEEGSLDLGQGARGKS